MTKWSGPKEIKLLVGHRWDKGGILNSALLKDDLFPLRIKLNSPTPAEVNKYFPEMIEWITSLKKGEKSAIGYGYEIIEKEVNNKISGKNTIPIYVVIPTVQDAAKLLNKQRDLGVFLKNADELLKQWEPLKDWVAKNPFKLIGMGDQCNRFIKVLAWFEVHPKRYLYLRQLDIPGVDTKFIETNKAILADLLDFTLPKEQMRMGSTVFEEKYGLKQKPKPIRFRILDKAHVSNGLADMTVPLDEFIECNLSISRFFITENEINFLSFPETPNSCVICKRQIETNLYKIATTR